MNDVRYEESLIPHVIFIYHLNVFDFCNPIPQSACG